MARELRCDVDGSEYAGLDFGGAGRDVLLVPQVASNAQVWGVLGPALAEVCHPVAIDLRGHGQSVADVDDIADITGDLPAVSAALGLDRPVVVLEHEELLALAQDRLAGLDTPCLVVMSLASCRRGEAAQLEWDETLGPDSLDVWVERFGLFASGAPEQRAPYLDDLVARSARDWLTESLTAEQLRAYFSRHLRDVPGGWRRYPERDVLERALRHISVQPHGLDLLDSYEGVLWSIVPTEALDGEKAPLLTQYAVARPDREARFVPGGPGVDTVDVYATADVFRQMLDAVG